MSKIKTIGPNDPEYKKAKEVSKPRHNINYRTLASEINNSPAGTIIKVDAPKKSYSNIKVGLAKRRLEFDKHYTMAFSSQDNEEVFYITVTE